MAVNHQVGGSSPSQAVRVVPKTNETQKRTPVTLYNQPGFFFYGTCPGGEGAALKAVGLKGLAGSNPVCAAS